MKNYTPHDAPGVRESEIRNDSKSEGEKKRE
jgi:hypothetical protein